MKINGAKLKWAGFWIALILIPVLAFAGATYWPNGISTYNADAGTYGTAALGNTTVNGTLTSTGAATLASASVTGALTQGTAGSLILTSAAVSLTSPTVTFSAANKRFITLNSNANQTGHYPTGGALGQVITIISGTGSNTMRFDDGTSLPLGGNITLTEGQGDVLTLICTTAEGDEWAAVSAHDN